MNRRTALLVLGVAPAALVAANGNKYFTERQLALIRDLSERIIPADSDAGGATDAKVPELIDLLASENPDYQQQLSGGLAALDEFCRKEYSHAYLDCSPEQRTRALDAIASPEPTPFYVLLRDLTLAGYFTSEIGMKYLGYQGNHFRDGFPGCPTLP
jgi:gluconate 2-dehydrogenase gamma chain